MTNPSDNKLTPSINLDPSCIEFFKGESSSYTKNVGEGRIILHRPNKASIIITHITLPSMTGVSIAVTQDDSLAKIGMRMFAALFPTTSAEWVMEAFLAANNL